MSIRQPALLIAAFFFNGCTIVHIAPRQTGTIKGVVISDVNFLPVQGARISLSHKKGSTISASDGSFQFQGVRVGKNKVLMSADGYASDSLIEIQVSENRATCVMLRPHPPSFDVSRDGNFSTEPESGIVLIVDGFMRMDLLHVTSTGAYTQIRNPFRQIPDQHMRSSESIRPDSAVRIYGERAAKGAIVVTTVAAIPCKYEGLSCGC